MSLKYLPSDLLSYVISFLDDKTSRNLICTSTHMYNHGLKYGYIKSLKVTDKTNLNSFIKVMCQHSKTIKSLEFYEIDHPEIWMPFYVKNIAFINCRLPGYLDPNYRQKPESVKSLRMIDCRYDGPFNIDYINYSKFTELELSNVMIYYTLNYEVD